MSLTRPNPKQRRPVPSKSSDNEFATKNDFANYIDVSTLIASCT